MTDHAKAAMDATFAALDAPPNTVPAVHCPDCGANTRRVTDDDGDVRLVCTNDLCERVFV